MMNGRHMGVPLGLAISLRHIFMSYRVASKQIIHCTKVVEYDKRRRY